MKNLFLTLSLTSLISATILIVNYGVNPLSISLGSIGVLFFVVYKKSKD